MDACHGPVVGIDEAGRGPWAGPVVVAAVILNPDRIPEGLNDSKVLTAEAREDRYAEIIATACVSVVVGNVRRIDRINILHASMLAMRRAVLRLGCLPDLALIDGNRAPDLPCLAETVVDGDRDVPAIGAASIVAKVTRDRLMRRLAVRYPGYGWETNVGYATSEHREAVRRLGATCHHRRSFVTVQAVLL